jgi:hypothetical protein
MRQEVRPSWLPRISVPMRFMIASVRSTLQLHVTPAFVQLWHVGKKKEAGVFAERDQILLSTA